MSLFTWFDEHGVALSTSARVPTQAEQERMRRLVTDACVQEAHGDVDAALSAVELIMETEAQEALRRVTEHAMMKEMLAVWDAALDRMKAQSAAALSMTMGSR